MEDSRNNAPVLTEATGAQILPPVRDERATISAYYAHLAADADQRTKHPEYAALAAGLVIRRPGAHAEAHA